MSVKVVVALIRTPHRSSSHLAVPFRTEVLGMEVTVERIDMTDEDQIVAVVGVRIDLGRP